jgi:hypothetical protein
MPFKAICQGTGELLVGHTSGLPPETLHQGPLLVGEMIAVLSECALKVLPCLPQKGRFRCGPPCQVPQYVFAHKYLPGV